jgi:catechol 2,3-dioxygenase-like lactoylglutathione lyase family enzyme
VKASRIFETCLYTTDLAAAERCYTRVLGLEVASRIDDRGLTFRGNWPAGGRSLYIRDPAGNLVELAPPTLWGFGTRSAP